MRTYYRVVSVHGDLQYFATTTKDGIRAWTGIQKDALEFPTKEEALEEARLRVQNGWHLRNWRVAVEDVVGMWIEFVKP